MLQGQFENEEKYNRQPIAGADIDALGDEIALLSSRIDAAQHHLLTLIRDFDEAEGWARQGAKSCADWLTWRLGLDIVTAREKVRVARALERLPAVDDAFKRGKLSYSKIRAITRVGTAENEDELLHAGLNATGAQLDGICRTYKRVAEPRDDGTIPTKDPNRYVRSYPVGFGMVRIDAQLTAEEAAVLMKALDGLRFTGNQMQWAGEHSKGAQGKDSLISAEGGPPLRTRRSPLQHSGPDTPNSTNTESPHSLQKGPGTNKPPAPSSLPERGPSLADRADALVGLAHSVLEAGSVRFPSTSPRFEVVMNVDEASLRGESELLATLDGGEGIPPEMARQITCDAALVKMEVDAKGEVLSVGRKTRTIPPSLRRALRKRDGGCRFPGCSHRIFVDGHHIHHWVDGGETKLDNLVLLCKHHHRLIHEEGFTVEMGPDGPLFRDALGERIAAEAARPSLPRDALGGRGFLAWLDAAGIEAQVEGYADALDPWRLDRCLAHVRRPR